MVLDHHLFVVFALVERKNYKQDTEKVLCEYLFALFALVERKQSEYKKYHSAEG